MSRRKGVLMPILLVAAAGVCKAAQAQIREYVPYGTAARVQRVITRAPAPRWHRRRATRLSGLAAITRPARRWTGEHRRRVRLPHRAEQLMAAGPRTKAIRPL